MTDRLAESFAQVDRDRKQLRTILSGMVEGVVALDNEMRVLFANERATQLLESAQDQIVGRKLWEVTRQRAVQQAAEKALAGAGPYREELDWTGAADKSMVVYASRLPGPNSPGAVMVLHDITEIRRLERLRQDFVANVSHELKTPLANIKSSVEVLLDGAAEDPVTRSMFLSEIDIQAERLNALVADLLSLARIESGTAILEFEAVAVEDAVHACLDRHRTRAEVKGLSLSGVALGGCPPTLAVWADEEALAQILDNLVDNAIKYTPRAGRVTVRWEATAEQVSVEVDDTGIGIPERDVPRVFERFYRVDKARSREMGGTGLGLAIVKHMAQTMNGSVRVAASEVNKGTTFRVCLPRAADGK
ncbi:sensor histidine kinase [Fimbriiglobus ruber]|uniref:histidine kinase n=1 Tax=Fimbriiglobus ruber TaxID=1908690 RepID=A0A225EDZ6_9BACT|nr:ATP-binding protein [Fimbriiglobus ruber]OWK46537.1 Phosphate regulon sensor protein PhoR (SphS) [Fimbriiglobus ruber]